MWNNAQHSMKVPKQPTNLAIWLCTINMAKWSIPKKSITNVSHRHWLKVRRTLQSKVMTLNCFLESCLGISPRALKWIVYGCVTLKIVFLVLQTICSRCELSKTQFKSRSKKGQASRYVFFALAISVSRKHFVMKKCGSTCSASIWGLLWRNPKGFFILISFRGCTSHFRFTL